MRKKKSIGPIASASVALLPMIMQLNGGPARAQAIEQVPALSEVVVTAQYREQGSQDTPISLAAISGTRIAEMGVRAPADLQFLVPNFTLAETGISTNIFVRGIGSGVNQGFEQSVGYYIDGINYPRAQQARMPFLDLERVAVLRGPQAILFGKNSIAGALNVSTAKPTNNFEAFVNTSYEFEYHEAIIEGAVSGPISDRLRARVAARYRDSDGYVQNLTLNQSEPKREEWAVRATLGFDISDNLVGSFKAEFNNFDVSGRHIEIVNEKPVTAGPFKGLEYAQILAIAFGQDSSVLNNTLDNMRSATIDFSKNEQSSYVLELDWGLGGHELSSISAFTNLDYNELCDCDFTGAHIFLGGLQESYAQFSQEFRLTSPVWDQFDYLVGAYIQTSDHDFADQIMVPANSVLVPAINGLMPGAGSLIAATEARRNANVNADFYSVFAQANVRPLDRLTLQIGGRLTRELKNGSRTLTITGPDGTPLPALQAGAPIVYGSVFDVASTNLGDLGPPGEALIAGLGQIPVRATRNETRFSPDIKLLWQASTDAMFYFSWATGFKSGGFDFRANNRGVSPTLADSFVFEDEKATNYELGTKVTFLGGSAEFGAAGFYTQYDDLQITIFDGTLGYNVGNAASADVRGIEFDGRIALSDYIILSGALALTDFEFTDFKNGQCYIGQNPDVDFDGDGTPELCDYTGNSNQLVSDVQANLSLNVHYPIHPEYQLSGIIDLFYTSDYDSSATFDPALKQGSYSTIDARLALHPNNGGWEIALLGKNLTDQQVLQFGGDTPLSGPIFGAKSNYAFFSQGRTLTLQARARF